MAKKNKTGKKKIKKSLNKGPIKDSSQKTAINKSKSNFNAKILIPLLLVLTALVFLPIKDLGFVNWDDPDYVTNSAYRALNFDNIKTAFLAGIHPEYPDGLASNYHPLTMISLMVNNSFFGEGAASYHWLNLLIHLANVYLSFVFFHLLLGKKKTWLALLGATIFAIHPMHVESVAWISERKDVLFVMFYLLGLNYYLKGKSDGKSRMVWVYIFFVLSLLSKPSAVTFPVVLVLIDIWKEGRLNVKGLLSKAPLFVLSVIFGLITLSIQGDVAVGDLDKFSLFEKITFGSYGICYYIYKFFLPTATGAYHPYPGSGNLPLFMTICPWLVLIGLGLGGYYFRKNKLVLLGIGFFIVNLLLTLQFVQVGPSAVSDRYTYLSYHGLIILLLFGLGHLTNRYEKSKPLLIGIASLWLVICAYRSYQQTKTWTNGGTLWNNVLQLYPKSHFALKARGEYYYDTGRIDAALSDVTESLKTYDDEYLLHLLHGNILRKKGDGNKALEAYNRALTLEKEDADLYNNRANALLQLNRKQEARNDYEKCLSINPNHQEALSNIGAYYFSIQDYKTAIEKFNQAIERFPKNLDNYLNRAGIYLSDGQYQKSINDVDTYLSKTKATAKAHYIKALAYEELKNIPVAKVEITKAFQMEPSNEDYKAAHQRISAMTQ